MHTAGPWFALQTRSKHERKVESLLKQKGYECFTPTYRLKRKWSDRVVEIDFPLFAGYVFCRFNASALGKAISTRGVTSIVGFGGTPAEVASEEIESLQLLAQSNLLRKPWKYLPSGIMALIETGPLAGIRGIISVDENKIHLVISVTLLQRSVAIQLNEDTVISIITDPIESGSRVNGKSYLAVRLLRS
jgi:transcription antitermination factor NusG